MLNRNSVFTRLTESFTTPSSSHNNAQEVQKTPQEATTSEQSTPIRNINNEELKGKVETKIISLWHNMKYGWSGKMRSSFSKESAIWFLGRCYHRKMTPCPSMEASVEITNTNLTNTENRLMTLSMHEEQPTSSESYFNIQTPTSDNGEIDRAIEPAEETGQDVIGNYEDGIDGFKKDFISRIWMTYRKDFAMMQVEPSNASNGYTSDCGWGCMIRSGQMMLAQALVMHFLSRSWRYDPESQIFATAEDHIHRKIIRWFGDQVSKNSPFSIHAMVELGKASGKKVGEWYGPGAVAHLLKQAVKQSSKENLDLTSLHVYVAQDCTIYNQDIFDECYSQENQSVPWQQQQKPLQPSPTHIRREIITWKALILLIPLRLGHEKLNPIYGDCLKAMLSLEWCIGIIGGRPKHSLFFVGYQDDKLIHLDPHYCQDMVNVNIENFSLSSFHCKSPRKMKISKMDPSCCLGFYISSRNDYDRFQSSVQPYLLPIKNYADRLNNQQQNCIVPQKSYGLEYNYPMFVFSAGRVRDQSMDLFTVRNNFPSPGSRSRQLSDDDDDDGIEDFVIV
ncbi:CLUMA_CG019107, isoform A [Clunio marinus]|uniref:Cysteine protease n=1 Tax=Clunio marinus TaxID=568069 RepID=A0A1J1J5L2_9DIPT|nr:CLUMA_CG019107, isoform A [Clunio marinus]